MTLVETEHEVIMIAAEELGLELADLNRDTKLDAIFNDSLEYIAFTLRLADLGHLSEKAISEAETLGDLADALIHPN